MVLPRLHIITDDDVLAESSFLQSASDVLDICGPEAVLHVRGHRTDGAILFGFAERLVAIAARTGSWIVLNDRIDIALGAGAHGVQLGANSLPIQAARALAGIGRRIGFSAHDAKEAAFAAGDGADWVLMGTIYDSTTHPGVRPAGLDALRHCAEHARVPVIAIGGVTTERVAQIRATEAHGIAVLGGVWRAQDVGAAALAYRNAVRAAWNEKEQEQ